MTRKGTKKWNPLQTETIAVQMMWAYLALTIIGNGTFMFMGAAPPWYVELYGLGVADLSVAPSAAGGLRFDEMLGLPIFAFLYKGTNTSFGAIPSLHMAYTVLGTYFAFKIGRLGWSCLVFTLLTAFSAVYLNHHYIIDLILGAVYAGVISVLFDRFVLPKMLAQPKAVLADQDQQVA
jgi:membrane-associated phospholipid phosphatase